MLAGRTISTLTFGLISAKFSMPLLAVWESIIGLGLITAFRFRITLLLLYLQMIGTFLPLIFFSNETWTGHLLVPTLLGQYIIKNIVLISSAIVIGATSHGGALISDPSVAEKAQHLELLNARFRRRFDVDPPQDVPIRRKVQITR